MRLGRQHGYVRMISSWVILTSLSITFDLRSASGDEPGNPDSYRFAPVEPEGVAIYRDDADLPILVVHAPTEMRPYIHPIRPQDGLGVLTEMRPEHHPHQTGLYVGFLKVNGRDYFHHGGSDYFQRQRFVPPKAHGSTLQWLTQYSLLGADGETAVDETQRWAFTDLEHYSILDLTWTATAARDITFGQHDYGGLFLRMPWRAESGGVAVNSEGGANVEAEGKPARWVVVSMPIEGRADPGLIAILDHPENFRHPVFWRIDGQLGVGPAVSRAGPWNLGAGESITLRYRLMIDTGDFDPTAIDDEWERFASSSIRSGHDQ